MYMSELKSCPLCGAVVRLKKHEGNGKLISDTWSIVGHHKKCFISKYGTRYHGDEKYLIETWNYHQRKVDTLLECIEEDLRKARYVKHNGWIKGLNRCKLFIEDIWSIK